MAAISPTYEGHVYFEPSEVPLNSYLITYKGSSIVCKTHDRARAIDMALMTDEIGERLSANAFVHGRPISNYSQIPDLQVIQIRPCHRIHADLGNRDYMYMKLSKLSVFDGENSMMDLATTIGAFDKIKIYTDTQKIYSLSTYDSYDLQTPVNGQIDPYEVV